MAPPSSARSARWRCRDLVFDLSERVRVMGILNVTPDSFSDGGRFLDPATALERAREMTGEGAEIVDVGAESTRPGSQPVAADEQWRRLEPVVTALAADPALCVSVDTASARVAELALAAGARIINDVSALGDPDMAAVVARSGAGLVLMHMRGTPASMQQDPRYQDVVGEVADFLTARLERARAANVAEECTALDPGIGFGKTAAHNHQLIAGLSQLTALGRPVLVGISRKSFLKEPLALGVDQRLEAGLAATAIAVFQGATIVRTHDVAATVRAVRAAEALAGARREVVRSG